MREAAADERFEEAARYRNRLFSIRHLADRQAADRRDVGSVDVIGLASNGERATVQVFPLRDGKMIDRYAFHLENVAGEDTQSILEAFVPRVLRRLAERAARGAHPVRDRRRRALAEFLGERRGARVVVRTPLRGEKRRLVELAAENAQLALEADAAVSRGGPLRRIAALEELREVLNLESLPVRIECFDVSNIQGESIVASMTVFVDGKPKNAHYRTFADPGARRSGRRRRDARGGLATVRAHAGDRADESFSRIPNLVVVDGGKGQLAAALAAIEELDLPRVAVISLAKREEEVFVPGFPAPILLDRSSPALQLLQRIRDEAHRFALRFHRRAPRSARWRRSSRRRPAWGRCGGARSSGTSAPSSDSSRRRRRSSRAFRGSRQKTARDLYAQLHKAGPS